MEKIHWSNLSVVFKKDKSFYFTSRETVLDEAQNFFNENEVIVVSGMINNLSQAAEFILSHYEKYGFDHIQFIGEIFGGSYPGLKNNHARKIQKWVYYSPDNNWMIFDILLTMKNNKNWLKAEDLYTGKVDIIRNPETNELVKHPSFFEYDGITLHIDSDWIPYKYLSKNEAIAISGQFSLPFVPILWIDTLDKLISTDVDTMESEVYKSFNLDKVDNNISEGIVICPYDEDYRTIIGKRVIIKKKSNKFKEVSHAKKEYVIVELPDEIKNILTEATKYLTEQRAESALSKFPESEWYEGKVIWNFTKDVFDEVIKNNQDSYNELSNEVKTQFKKELNAMSVSFIKNHLGMI